MTQDAAPEEILSARFKLEFDYTRSVGPVVGRFLMGLLKRRIEGIRMSDGRVLVPPTEYDPLTSESLEEFVEVGEGPLSQVMAHQAAQPGSNIDRLILEGFAVAAREPDGRSQLDVALNLIDETLDRAIKDFHHYLGWRLFDHELAEA